MTTKTKLKKSYDQINIDKYRVEYYRISYFIKINLPKFMNMMQLFDVKSYVKMSKINKFKMDVWTFWSQYPVATFLLCT